MPISSLCQETDYLDDAPASNWRDNLSVYKEKQNGFKVEKCERESGEWVKKDVKVKSKSREFATGTAKGMAVGIAGAANKMLLNKGIGVSTGVDVSAAKVDCDVHVAEIAGLEILDAGAEAKAGNASAGASATPIEVEAFAKTSGAEVDAHADLIEGVLGVHAKAVAVEAEATAGVGLKSLGAHAG